MFLVLAIVYVVICKIDQDGIGTVLVQNSLLNEWGCSLKELHENAMENTMRIFPAQIQSMEDIIMGLIGRMEEDDDLTQKSASMYVVSNRKNLQGACVVLYPDILKDSGV